MASLRAKSRRRPLHTCAASMFGIIDTAYKRSQHLDGPLGNFIKRLTTLASSAIPFASKIQHLGLTTLSLTDDHILFFERIAESVFPPSGRVFDKIDMLVCSAEGLPNRFEEALNTFPSMMHQIPFLDWVLMHLIWCLNFLISILTNWGSRHTKEKEIMIDTTFDPCGNNPIESPTKPDYSGKAQGHFLFIESPVKANSTVLIESTDKQNFNEAQAQSVVKSADKETFDEPLSQSIAGSNDFVESADKENADETQGQSMVSSNESVESADKENADETQGQSMVSSNESVESADKENANETQGQSMVSSNESVELTGKENSGESLGQSMVFVEENLDEAMEESMEVSNKTENSAETQEQFMYHDLEEKSAEKKNVQLPKTEESENKADDDDDDRDQEHQTDTNESTLSPTESFQSAQFEDTISPSGTNESFHETKSFENVELPTTDEDETKEKLFKKGGKEKLDHSPSKTAQTTSSSSYGKNKAKGEKKTSVKDNKKNNNKVEDQAKILELLEAKWHMM